MGEWAGGWVGWGSAAWLEFAFFFLMTYRLSMPARVTHLEFLRLKLELLDILAYFR